MKERVELLVREFRDARRHRLRFEAAVTALSVLVTGGVFWQLRRVGTAISEEGAPPGVSVVETDADPPDQTAEAAETAEDPADWEALLPEFTDESPQQRIAAIAVSQLGYTEGAGEVLLSDDGISRTGYTRYGAWYGNPYGEWNTMFTYFCMYYAGIEKDRIPYGSGCWAWYETLSENGMLTPCGNETEGDIIFFDSDADGEPDRTGIVSGTEETEEGVQLHVIAGNCEGAVAEQQYLRGGSDMVGVLSVDSYLTEPLTPAEPEIVLISYSADSESGIHVDAQAAEGVFPEGTVMKAADVPDEEALQAANDALGETANIHDAVAVDISFYTAEGEEIEPADGTTVSVQISLPSEKKLDDGVHMLLHVDDEGESALVEGAEVAADGAVFEAEAFSVYIVTSLGRAVTYNNGDTIRMKAGESFTLFAEGIPQDSGRFYEVWDNQNNYISPAVWNKSSRDALIEQGLYDIVKFPDGTERHEITFTAEKATPASGNTLRIHSPNGDTYNVEITDSPIMVLTSHGYKDSDRIREWLGEYKDGTTFGLNCPDWWHMTNEEGYVPNSNNRPYQLPVGDSVTFYCDSRSAADTFSYSFTDSDGNYISTTRMEGSWPPTAEVTDLGNGWYRHKVTLTAKEAGYTQVSFTGSNETFWIRNWDRHVEGTNEGQAMNHADMEIADGGTYTVSSTYVDEEGVTHVDVKVYRADITYVNKAYILDKNGNSVVTNRTASRTNPSQWTPVECYTSDPDEEVRLYRIQLETLPDGSLARDADGYPIPKLVNGQVVPDYNYPLGDYEQFGIPGGTQYEMTSAWIMNLKKGYRKVFDSRDADHARFDVNMHLTPQNKYSYTIDENGEMKLQPDPNNPDHVWNGEGDDLATYDPENVIFNLDHQDVLDAMNKCPLNNGLDFTARAEFTVLQLPIQKEMMNGVIKDGEFSYDVIDLNPQKLSTTKENAVLPALYETAADTFLADYPDVSEGAKRYHQFTAYEAFTENGDWGSGVNGAGLLDALKQLYVHGSRPYQDCNSAAAVKQVLDNTADDAVKQAFYKTIEKYLTTPVADAGDDLHFQSTRKGFLVIRDSAAIAETVSCDADGKASLQNMRFDMPKGETEYSYYFAIHEKTPVETMGINYDQNLTYIKVTIKNQDGFLIANVDRLIDNGSGQPETMAVATEQKKVKFSNAKIILPDTGGTGPLPYLAVGTLLITAAFALPLIRRRKEDECDS